MNIDFDVLVLNADLVVAEAFQLLVLEPPGRSVVVQGRNPRRFYIFTVQKLRWLLEGATLYHTLDTALQLHADLSDPYARRAEAAPTFYGVILNDHGEVQGVSQGAQLPRPSTRGETRSFARPVEPVRELPPESAAYARTEPDPVWPEPAMPAPSPAPGAAPVAAQPVELPRSTPVERYADFVISSLDRSGQTTRLQDHEPLRVGQEYELEVAVRAEPIGFQLIEGERRPIFEPVQAEAVTVIVTAEVLDPDLLEITEPVARMTLPVQGDSTSNARFTLRALAPADDAAVRIRMFYEFNLLEVATLRLAIARRSARAGTERVHFLIQERVERPYTDFQDVVPRAMHIDVNKQDEAYTLTFTLSDARDRDITFVAPIKLSRDALDGELAELRKLWYDLAFSDYGTQLEGSMGDFIRWVRELAGFGHRLWVRLFFQPGSETAIHQVGRWLEAHPLAERSLIQISLDRSAEDFVFPWALLYDRKLPEQTNTLPPWAGFWGLRCNLEQGLPGTRRNDRPSQTNEALQLAFMLWERFAQAAQQKALIERLQQESNGALQASNPPITSAADCKRLLRAGDAHIFYFFTHGYMRQKEDATRVSEALQLLIDRFKALPDDSPIRAAYQFYYDAMTDTTFRSDSWIKLSNGRLLLTELYDELRDPHLHNRPLVFLNMCHSAQVTPALPDSFVQFFGAQGAGAVIGTECPMTSVFASAFAEQVLSGVLRGDTAGSALLGARRYFMERRNPLGLAYTMYGSATLRFTPPPIDQAEQRIPIAAPAT